MNKICTKCKSDLPKTDFYANHSMCKKCQGEYMRAYREANPERINAYAKSTWQRTKDRRAKAAQAE